MNTVTLYQEQQQSILPPNTTDDLLIQMWLQNKRSACTRESYAIDLAQFRAFTDYKPFKQLTLLDAQAFQSYLEQTDYKRATIRRKLTTLKSILTFGAKTGYLIHNVGVMIQLPSLSTNIAPKILSEEEVHKLLVAMEWNTRNHCILRLLYHTGMRLSELCNLTWDDITSRENGMGQLHVMGKGEKERFILLQPSMYAELLGLKTDTPEVFSGYEVNGNSRLKAGAIQDIVAQAVFLAGISKPVSPHWLRHSAASHALKRGATITVVRDALGHGSIRTTNTYLTSSPDESLGKYLSI